MDWLRFSYRLILLPGFAGLACLGCRSAGLSSVSETVDTSVAIETKAATRADNSVTSTASTVDSFGKPLEATNTPVSEVEQAASAAAYREGINLASSAYVLSQSAFSPDDWDLIASRWQRAADVLEAVHENDQNYSTAQQKIVDYKRQHEAAIAKITHLNTTPVYTPVITKPAATPTRSVAAIRNEPVSRTAGNPRRVSVPIVRRLQGTPVVRVTFSHGTRTRTYEMILDTGASRTLITRAMANELGIVATEQMVANTASQARVTFDVGRIDAISIEEVTLSNAQVSIGEAVSVGLLGNDFLRGYDLTIQTRRGVIELTEAS